MFWAVYVTPNVGMTGKLIYAYITYLLVMMFYSANNTPYAALMGVMTANVSERANIARYRFVAALIGHAPMSCARSCGNPCGTVSLG